MDWIWYAGVLAAMVAHTHPETKLLILGFHVLKETLDWWHRRDHNRRLLAIEQQLRDA